VNKCVKYVKGEILDLWVFLPIILKILKLELVSDIQKLRRKVGIL
jgi:hypothetical protein